MDIQSTMLPTPHQKIFTPLQEIRIGNQEAFDVQGRNVLYEIHHVLGFESVIKVRAVKIYRLEGIEQQATHDFASSILIDHLYQTFSVNSPLISDSNAHVEIAYKPGVMNPEVASLMKVARDQGYVDLKAVDTSWEYHFYGAITDDQLNQILKRLLVNDTVEHIVKQPPLTLQISDIKMHHAFSIPIRTMFDEQLVELAQQRQLFLNLTEMQTIKNFFVTLARDPFDVELETLAQTWSEHCSHKTFKAPLRINGKEKESLFGRLKKVAAHYNEHIVSAFVDNAGALSFYEDYAILAKVETHNSPSAIEPYGGAATGVGGVIRDIMGTGTGAKVIATTDIFCFAKPDLPAAHLPPGCLAPRYLLRNVVAGVRDYGNRMGVPTNNGSLHFHDDFRAKPTVIVGAYGITKKNCAIKQSPNIGNLIFVVGGPTGRDGIHGATFSSGHMTASTISVHATAVQIGNPIEEKRMADALLAAQEKKLIVAITDCGAGGFSSAIGEMAAHLGAYVELSNVPLKYNDLMPWEIWISESQERMICAIDKDRAHEFIEKCNEFNVPAHEIGFFSESKKLVVAYHGAIVCDLSMDFLHDGLPVTVLDGYTVPREEKNVDVTQPVDWQDIYCRILSHWNVCSKEPIVRQYDHGVQGTNALAPFTSRKKSGPNDAVILCPLLGKPYGVVISHGLNPILNRIDVYAGCAWAITEAMANLVAVGGNPAHVGLIDNFIWPKPHQKLIGDLDYALQACIDAMHAFKIPFISGKDSLSSTYKYSTGEILEIPPVLCISAMGKIPNVYKTVSADFKKVGSLIILVGTLDVMAIGASVYQEILGLSVQGKIPNIILSEIHSLFGALHNHIDAGNILACHDISEGGIAVTLAEMCFGGEMGVEISTSSFGNYRPDFVLFNETSGCFLIEVSQETYNKNVFSDIPHTILGHTIKEKTITVHHENKKLFQVPLDQLYNAWQQPMQEIFQ